MKNTRNIHNSDTVHFHHKFITALSKTPENKVTTAAKNLTKVILTTKLVKLNETDKQALKQLNDIFTNAVNTKNQSQPQSHETNVNIPKTPPIKPTNKPATHSRMSTHAKQQDHTLQGCVKIPQVISTHAPPQTENNISSQLPMPIMPLTQDKLPLQLAANM